MANSKTASFSYPSDREAVMTYVFDAPRELVFKAYMDSALVPQWWGPRNLTTTVDKMDVRPSGAWRFIQRDQAGKEYAFNGVYREVVPPERVIYTFEYEDMEGHVSVDTVTFEEQDGKTKMTDKTVFQTAEDLQGMLKEGMEGGATESMERLAEVVENMQQKQGGGKASATTANEATITRVFDAPRELVWKSWTEPERVQRWWGPKDFTSPFCSIDLRVGGKYLISMRSPDGKEFWSTGVYREIIPLERIVNTDSFADEKGNVVPATYYGMSSSFPLEMQATTTFEEQEGKTRLTLKYSGTEGLSAEDRDNMIQGWNESFDKLAQNLNKSRLVIKMTLET